MLRIDALVGRWSSNEKLHSLLFNFAYQLIIMLLNNITYIWNKIIIWQIFVVITFFYDNHIPYLYYMQHFRSTCTCIVFVYVRKHTSLLVVSATRRKWTLTVTMSTLTLMVIQPNLAPPTSPGTGEGPMRSYSGTSEDRGGLPRPRNGRKNWRVI